MSKLTNDEIRQNVRQRYKEFAIKEPITTLCSVSSDYDVISSQLGYSNEELSTVPQGSNLGLGCGNPQAIADLKVGEIVLDLGSGAGFDCFLASAKVGLSGKVIGVDMTPEMVTRARTNAAKGEFINTDFRLGEIENLPVADTTVDVIISNCVINLSPDKQQVFNEAFRVLQPGGRLAISDIITTASLPPEIKNDLDEIYSGCISGASSMEEVKFMLHQSGFESISIEPKDASKSFIKNWIPNSNLENYTLSAVIKAMKPIINEKMNFTNTTVRKASIADLDRILEIYNQGIEDRIATLEMETKDLNYITNWFEEHQNRFTVLVAESNESVIGWASLNRYSHRCAYDGVADLSIYIDRNFRGKGIGRALYNKLEQEAKINNFYKIVLFTFPFNHNGQRLYRKVGYREVGVFEKQGIMDGRFIDVMIMEKILQ